MKVVCPKCKGRGTVKDLLLAVFTFGLSLIDDTDFDRNTCKHCKGKGYLKF